MHYCYTTYQDFLEREMSMKKHGSFTKYSIGLLAVGLCLLASINQAHGIDLYWYGGVEGGDWNTTDTAWSLATGGTVDQTWANGSNAIFELQAEAMEFTVAAETPNIGVTNMSFVPTGAAPEGSFLILGGGGDIALTSGSVINVGSSGAPAAIAAKLVGAGASLTKTGDGQLTLGGANTYDGGTTVNGGILMISVNDALSTGNITALSGTLNLGAKTQNTAAAVSFQGGTVSNGTINKTGGGDYDAQAGTASAALSGTVGLSKTGTATFTLSGANTYTGATTINDGIVDLGASVQTLSGGLVMNGGTLQNGTFTSNTVAVEGRAGTISAVLAGTAGLNKTTTGTLTLSGNNTFTGKTAINGGNLYITSTTSLGANPATWYTADQVTMAGGTSLVAYTPTGATINLQNRGVTITGDVTFGVFINSGNTNFRLDSVITGNGGITLTTSLGSITAGNISLGGNGTVDPNTQAQNTYTGDTVMSSGWFSSRNHNAFPHGVGYGDMYILPAATWGMNGHCHSINGLNGGGNIDQANNNSRWITLGVDGSDGNFTGRFNLNPQAVTVMKWGAGTQTFATNVPAVIAVNGGKLVLSSGIDMTNIRAMDVNGGELDVTNLTLGSATQTAARNINARGTIDGSISSVVGASGFTTLINPGIVTVVPAATASWQSYYGGNAIGDLTISGDLTLGSFGGLTAELGGTAAGAFDKLNVTGTLNLLADSVLNVTLSGSFAPALGDSFDIMDWGTLSGTFGTINPLPTLSPGLFWDTSALDTSGTISVVPEPATFVLLAMAAAMLFVWRRKR
jgi:autotransporter-associated beta strand protein